MKRRFEGRRPASSDEGPMLHTDTPQCAMLGENTEGTRSKTQRGYALKPGGRITIWPIEDAAVARRCM